MSKVRTALVLAAGLGLAAASQATAAPSMYKVTGGGQITQGVTQGAGSTIAFTAQSAGAEGQAAKGQFQLQNRVAPDGKGTGQGGETVHGTVTCVVVFSTGEGGMAVIGGKSRTGEDFRIDVTDDGQGGDAADLVSVRRGAAARDGGDNDSGDNKLCDAESEKADMALGRGNVKIHAVRS